MATADGAPRRSRRALPRARGRLRRRRQPDPDGGLFPQSDVRGLRPRGASPSRRDADSPRAPALANVTLSQLDLTAFPAGRRRVRLHHRARPVLVDSRGGARRAAGAHRAAPRAARCRLRELQRLSGLLRAPHGVGDAALPDRGAGGAGAAHRRGAGAGAAALRGAGAGRRLRRAHEVRAPSASSPAAAASCSTTTSPT